MGYFRGWLNFEDWYYYSGGDKIFICKWCGHIIERPKSENQKYHDREEDASCVDDRYFEGLWKRGKHPLQKIENEKE